MTESGEIPMKASTSVFDEQSSATTRHERAPPSPQESGLNRGRSLSFLLLAKMSEKGMKIQSTYYIDHVKLRILRTYIRQFNILTSHKNVFTGYRSFAALTEFGSRVDGGLCDVV